MIGIMERHWSRRAPCILIKEDNFNTQDREDIRSHAEASVLQFMDCARQVDQSFLQKRLLLSAHRPDWIIKEDTLDLKAELARKDELIKKTQDKIAFWKSTLAEVQHPRGPADLPPQLQDGQRVPTPGSAGLPPGLQQYRPMGPGGYMARGPAPPFPGHQGGPLHGHLAYLEKTTSNIA
ncbi:Mediator of RNA polymerase II transcription subunit 28 [Amphibalanus amphitrite]|uniref:Mediator of RNA polymerase II transcription subunit 28 n=1 Tax=Amphibalanus amphitrite TaxID=1232801 RepID=A0A6A4WAW5_AMPAM|nr:Mediator of RNA polymerase II transcription subunit 28 [Amphibalanus amphitrite]